MIVCLRVEEVIKVRLYGFFIYSDKWMSNEFFFIKDRVFFVNVIFLIY